MRWRPARWLALVAALVLASGAVFLLTWLQRRLLYFPVRQDLERVTAVARQHRLEPWADAGRFLGWRSAPLADPARAVLLVLHGNAGTALDRTYFRDVFEAAAPVEVVLLEYPGYGPRAGVPSQQTLVRACTDAVTLLARGGLPVVIVGESLGSAAAALCAADEPDSVAGLVLVTPLASVTAVAKRHYPFLPSALVRDAYHADEALPRYPGPVAFLVAARDEVVFTDLGMALYEGRTGPKRLWVDEGAGHNTVRYEPPDDRWREILGFVLTR